jgi:hypothetical protein
LQPVHKEEEGATAGQLGLSRRTTYYKTEATLVEHRCNAPTGTQGSDGRPLLCPRQDKTTCPFHGPIVPRDSDGLPLVAVAPPAPPAPAVKKRKRTGIDEDSALVDLKKLNDTSRVRCN